MADGDNEIGRRVVEGLCAVTGSLQHVAGDEADADVLCSVVRRAVDADHASLSVVRGATVTTLATTDDTSGSADRLQQETGEGPASGVGSARGTIRVDVLDGDGDGPWPEFGRRACRELDLHSMLTHVVQLGDGVSVVVTGYSRRRSAFLAEHEPVAALLGAVAAASVRGLDERRRADQLESALRTSRRIGAALGIIMATEDVDLDGAWDLLRSVSQSSNVKVADLAARVVTHGPYARLDVLAEAAVHDPTARGW
ncbi:ANTAR domain-containing protein [Rothia sp. ARF10]|nr:ANTAR domain-containing protein [Rothia sp. ARF10]